MGLVGKDGERLARAWRMSCTSCEVDFIFFGDETQYLNMLRAMGWHLDHRGRWHCGDCRPD